MSTKHGNTLDRRKNKEGVRGGLGGVERGMRGCIEGNVGD